MQLLISFFFEEIKQDKPFKLFARLLHFNDFYSQASYLLRQNH